MRSILSLALLLASLTTALSQNISRNTSLPDKHWQEWSDSYRLSSASRTADTEPLFVFETSFTSRTTLHDLYKVQKKVARQLRVQLTFRSIEFDSTGLSTITVCASGGKNFHTASITAGLTDRSDIGVYAISYASQVYWFIGPKAKAAQLLTELSAGKL